MTANTSRREASYMLSESLRTIDCKLASGHLRFIRQGGRVKIPYSELLRQAAIDDDTPVVRRPHPSSVPPPTPCPNGSPDTKSRLTAVQHRTKAPPPTGTGPLFCPRVYHKRITPTKQAHSYRDWHIAQSPVFIGCLSGDPGRSPTCDLRVRSALLYATELPGQLT